MRIIVASSDDGLRRFLAHILEGISEDVRTVSRSGELLKSVLDTDYDVVVITLDLGGMSGLETLPILKRLRPKTPVLMLSEDNSVDLRGEAIETGALHYFMLPINPPALISAILAIGSKEGSAPNRGMTSSASA
jgi:DNA-binding response OmpR family regulator